MLLLYIRDRWRIWLLYGGFLVVVFCIYGLYSLPWGPAVYVALLCTGIGFVLTLWDFINFRKRIHILSQVKEKGLPDPQVLTGRVTAEEKIYQIILEKMRGQCHAVELEKNKQLEQASFYYTRWNHQIKTPIAAMHLLLQEKNVDKQALERELLKTEQYVEMALQYQRLDSGTNDLVLENCSLDRLIKQAAVKLSPLFIQKKIALEIGNISASVLTDEKWMVFILEQLLSNSIKYTKTGKVSVYLEEGSGNVLVVEDTGIGILPEDIPRVFEWGYTGYNGRLDKRSTGIGLALCRSAANMLGHTITIESEIGKGTKVKLLLSEDQRVLE